MDRLNEEYIGDGVYASHDGYQIWLRTDRGGLMHEIALEPQVFARLVRYRQALYNKPTNKGKDHG